VRAQGAHVQQKAQGEGLAPEPFVEPILWIIAATVSARWLARAILAASVAEVLDEPSRAA
jgi:hypothetical protein